MMERNLTNASLDPSPGRRRTLQLLFGMPLMLAAASIAGCAGTNSAEPPRPKSYITGNGGADGKSNGGR